MKSLAFVSVYTDFILQRYGKETSIKCKKYFINGNFYLFKLCLKSEGEIFA